MPGSQPGAVSIIFESKVFPVIKYISLQCKLLKSLEEKIGAPQEFLHSCKPICFMFSIFCSLKMMAVLTVISFFFAYEFPGNGYEVPN